MKKKEEEEERRRKWEPEFAEGFQRIKKFTTIYFINFKQIFWVCKLGVFISFD